MSILIDSSTRIICQGFTGKQATLHIEQSLAYGTKILGGVSPGKGGSTHLNLPVFDTVFDATSVLQPDASIIFVPAQFAADAIIEAIDAKIKLIICITEFIPVLDMVKVKDCLRGSASMLVGPNTAGIITPLGCRAGIMPSYIYSLGTIGIVSRSGTLSYESSLQTTREGLGQSTVVGIGGDPVHGIGFIEVVEMFMQDIQTNAIMVIGEIGGSDEESLSEHLINKYNKVLPKPIIGFIAGKTAPPGKRMGHAGAIASDGRGLAVNKIAAMEKAGIIIADNMNVIGATVASCIKGK